ncbi:glutathione S-transferase A-like isoform X1 [Leucoraja erinacea]|uniref:glutathione S-transferase A-like isoform X1 n=1 Tax=Leucoraja erinaceus TaxID=7782 RepID=UPI0024576A56|nr:glutathione S-transferase A-like isoform X1 [Leucoraja erinacea]
MAESMLLFWGSGSPPCWRVTIALEEKKLQGYKGKVLSFEKMEHKSNEVLEINPRGQLPSFRHGKIVLNESIGICLYLENQFKSQGTQLIPDSGAEQALVYQRMFEVLTLQEKVVAIIYYFWKVPENERHESALERNKKALNAELNMWEGYLGKLPPNSHITGKNFTMADVMLFPQLACAFRFGLATDKYPRMFEYYSRVKERPSVKASWPPHWNESPPMMDVLKDI